MGDHEIITALEGAITGHEDDIAYGYVEPALQELDEEQARRAAIEDETRYQYTSRDTQPNRQHHFPPAEMSLTDPNAPMRRY